MHLQNANYVIDISEDETYTLQSVDNKHYDYIYNPCKLTRNNYIKTFSIRVSNGQAEHSIALIGSYFCSVHDCAVLDRMILTVLMNNAVSQIDIHEKQLIRYQILGEHNTNFAIYQIADGYILYGEMQITKLDFQLKKIWDFSGADIFVNPDGLPAFQLEKDRIKLHDWNGTYYELNFDGKFC